MYITNKLKRELVLKVDPEKKYPVSYTIRQDGSKINKPTFLKGKDLTEPQIVSLWRNGYLN